MPAGASSAAVTLTLVGVASGTGVTVSLGELSVRPTEMLGLDTRGNRRPNRIRHLSSSTTLSLDDAIVLVDATAGAVTINLPSAGVNYYGYGPYASIYQRRTPGSGLDYMIVRIDASANAVTVAAPASTTIEGASSITLASQWAKVRLLAAKPGLFVKG